MNNGFTEVLRPSQEGKDIMKRNRKVGATMLQYREVGAGELDRIRGGAIVVSDPGGGGNWGPKPTDPGAGVVVIGGDGPGGTGPN